MIVYSGTKKTFSEQVRDNVIAEKIYEAYQEHIGQKTSQAEIRSWENSMIYMNNVIGDPEIPDDTGVAIEYKIPLSSRRIDFILTGSNAQEHEVAVIIELKQWDKADLTDEDGIVETFVGGGVRKTTHPCYQAWSYARLIADFSETVEEDQIDIIPCAYLHNYHRDGILDSPFYQSHIEKAPIFFRKDVQALSGFIKTHVKYGDNKETLYRIDNGKIKPSKSLADNLNSLLKGNPEFVMIDDQKIIYEQAMTLTKRSSPQNKNVLIVEGGPGTGKSVVAINLLVKITKQSKLTQYVTKNSAPRQVYESKLVGSFKKSEISNLFSGSGSFHSTKKNIFDVLIVDEAHRLNAKSGMFKNMGENQIKEIINSAQLSIFFIDENQKVTLHDIGEKEAIAGFANELGATVHESKLTSQFRCNGSDGYLSWLDQVLQISETANTDLDNIDYDFRVFDSPADVRDLIYDKNKLNNKARMVAGYCWKWLSKKSPSEDDIVFPEYGFSAKWNLSNDGMLWIIKPESVKEVGCIHTCQGLEVDYIGVIIGPDLIVRDGKVLTDASKRASEDSSVRGHKKLLKQDEVGTLLRLDGIIKNTYRTLMTRGQKGCYVYSSDPETQEYFKKCLS